MSDGFLIQPLPHPHVRLRLLLYLHDVIYFEVDVLPGAARLHCVGAWRSTPFQRRWPCRCCPAVPDGRRCACTKFRRTSRYRTPLQPNPTARHWLTASYALLQPPCFAGGPSSCRRSLISVIRCRSITAFSPKPYWIRHLLPHLLRYHARQKWSTEARGHCIVLGKRIRSDRKETG